MGSHKKSRPYLVSEDEATNIIDDNHIRCPYCGKEFKALAQHLIHTHKKTREEVSREFPGTRYLAKSINSRMSAGADNWKSIPANLEKLKAKSSVQMSKQWVENKLFKANSIQNSTKRIRALNRDNNFRKKMGYHLPSEFDYISKGENFRFRSTWERDIAVFLDKHEIDWEYESVIVDLNKDHTYYPDFYLPKYNLIIEAHPKHLIDEMMLLKQKRTIEQGYKFMFITESEIVDLEKSFQCVLK